MRIPPEEVNRQSKIGRYVRALDIILNHLSKLTDSDHSRFLIDRARACIMSVADEEIDTKRAHKERVAEAMERYKKIY